MQMIGFNDSDPQLLTALTETLNDFDLHVTSTVASDKVHLIHVQYFALQGAFC